MAWRVLTRRSFVPSHHLIELVDAGATDPVPNPTFSDTGFAFGPGGILITVASDTTVKITVGFGGRPARGEQLGDGVITVGPTGLEIGVPPTGGEALLDWPAGRTRVAVFGPPGDPYERAWVALALTPLDALPPRPAGEAERIARLTALLGIPTAQESASESLRRIGAPAVPRLVEMLRDRALSPDARYGAASALGKIGGEEAVAALVDALSDAQPRVRRGAATGLLSLPRQFSSDQVIAALTRALSDHEDRIDWAAAMALGRLGDGRAIPVLVAVLDGGRDDLADAALYALAEVGDTSALPAIERALARCDSRGYGIMTPNVRLAALRARAAIEARARLGKTPRKRALPEQRARNMSAFKEPCGG